MASNTILFATDYSPESTRALPVAESLARDTHARLLIVHVSQSETAPVGELFDEEPEQPPEELLRLQSIVPSDPQIACEHRLLSAPPDGDAVVEPAAEILRLANQAEVSMIVVGTRGRQNIGRLFAGSVAETLIERATCPVVTVRQPAA